MTSRRPRVFLGFLDICGLYKSLEYGFRELGVSVCFLDLGEDYLGYRDEITLGKIPHWFYRTYKEHVKKEYVSKFNVGYLYTSSKLLLSSIVLCIWMLSHFDIFIFKAGRSFSAGSMLFKLLRLFKKTIIFTFHGSDSRPPYLNPVIKISDAELVELTEERKRYIDKVSPLANYIIDSPLSAHFQSRKCCVRQCIFNPTNINNLYENKNEEVPKSAIRILHAPSLPELKGTDVIRVVINKLMNEGYNIQYKELSGVPNQEVLNVINACDLIIDELYSDTYGAVFALEAASQGKPVIVCGYGSEELARFVPLEAVLPTHYCPPEKFESALRTLLDDDEYRSQLGKKAKSFAQEWAAPEAVAERLLCLAQGEAPDDWFFDPKDIRYVHGVGGTEAGVRKQIKRLIDHGGSNALFVNDKPQLQKTLVSFGK